MNTKITEEQMHPLDEEIHEVASLAFTLRELWGVKTDDTNRQNPTLHLLSDYLTDILDWGARAKKEIESLIEEGVE